MAVPTDAEEKTQQHQDNRAGATENVGRIRGRQWVLGFGGGVQGPRWTPNMGWASEIAQAAGPTARSRRSRAGRQTGASISCFRQRTRCC